MNPLEHVHSFSQIVIMVHGPILALLDMVWRTAQYTDLFQLGRFFVWFFWGFGVFLFDRDLCDLGWGQQFTYKALNSLHHLIIKAFSCKIRLSDMNPIRHRKDLSLALL